MCCQPGNRRGLPAPETDQRRRYSIKDATEMEACKIRGTTQPLVSRTGAGKQENILPFQSREKNVLESSSYRPRYFANLGRVYDSRLLVAEFSNGQPATDSMRSREMQHNLPGDFQRFRL